MPNGVRAAGLMRRATTEALYIARHRQAFGRRLIHLPLMRRQLMKLVLRHRVLPQDPLADDASTDAEAAWLDA